MAKIEDSKGRSDENSGYIRLFGNIELGHLISRVQATVIRTGNELEHLIKGEISDLVKTTLPDVLADQINLFLNDQQVVFNAFLEGEKGERGVTCDIIIFDHKTKEAKIIELKDGDTFDTKKSSGELESMIKFSETLRRRLGYKIDYFFCSFNQSNKSAIVAGAKGRFGIEHAMTGRELCDILGINYDAFRSKRENQQVENLNFFLTKLLEIKVIRQLIENMLK